MHFLELPLVFFTVLAQCAVGGYLLVIAHLNSIPDGKQRRLVAMKTIFFVLAFMTIGFASSTMHLGSPLRAFNSLNRVGGSGLSNEILTGSVPTKDVIKRMVRRNEREVGYEPKYYAS